MSIHDHRFTGEHRGGEVVLLTGPFGDAERRIRLDRPMAIGEVIAAHQLVFRLPTVAVLEGEPVLRGEWAVRMVRPGQVLGFVAVPGGGGSGGSATGKQVIGLVAALALSVAAPWAGAALFGAGTLGAALFTAAVTIGGSLLLNAMLGSPAADADADKAKSVFSLSASGNQARPLDVLPVLYGELRYEPPLASRPYAEFAGNDQILYQLFCATAGKAAVTKIEVGDAVAWTAADGYTDIFDDVEIEIIQPGGEIELFPANVVTSIDVAGQTVPDPPAMLGPFVVNAAGTQIRRIAVDYAFPGGLFAFDGRKIASNSAELRADYREIDDDGDPVGGWSVLFQQTITRKTRTPQRFTKKVTVPAGRYEVRFYAEADFDDGTEAVNAAQWVGLRGYLKGFETPSNCTLVALKMKANEQLSQAAASRIRITAARHLPTHPDAVWTAATATRSIAWAAADLLRNTDYGLGLSDSVFDIDALKALDATWAGRGDSFNALFDRSWTARDALTAILRAGRAQQVRLGGQVSFNRLEPKAIRRAVFTPRNVARGSFSHRLVLFNEEHPDTVVGHYLDETVWAEREVEASIGAIGADLKQRVDYFGITGHDQAWREAVTDAAVNAYQREFVGFTAEWEGKLLVRGEPILVQHPFIEQVSIATAADVDGATLTLDRDVVAPEGDAYVILRSKTGREWGPCLVDSVDGRAWTLDADDLEAVEGEMGTIASILPDDRSEPMQVLVCEGETRPFNGLVVSAVPGDGGRVQILAVNDAPEVYEADGTEIMPSPWATPSLPAKVPQRPQIDGLVAELRVGTRGLELDAMWQPAAGATSYVAQVSYDDGDSWTPVYADEPNRFTVEVLPQALVVRVAAIGELQGPWAAKSFAAGDVPDTRLKYVDFDPSIVERMKYLTQSIALHKKQFEEAVLRIKDLSQVNQGAFDELRQSLSVQRGEDRAYFDNQIVLGIGANAEGVAALAAQVTTMGLVLTDPVTGELVAANSLASTMLTVTGQGATLAAQGELLTAIDATLGSVSSGAKFYAQNRASPGGGWASAGIGAYASDGTTKGAAAIYVEAKTDGSGRAVLVGDSVVFSDTGGNIYALFDGTGAYFNNARIANLEVGNLRLKGGGYNGIDGNDVLLNASLITGLLAPSAVTGYARDNSPASSLTWTGANQYQTVASVSVTYSDYVVPVSAWLDFTGSGVTRDFTAVIECTISGTSHILDEKFIGTIGNGDRGRKQLSCNFQPPATGTYTLRLRLLATQATSATVNSASTISRNLAKV